MTGCERAGPPAGDAAAPGRSSARAEGQKVPDPGDSGPDAIAPARDRGEWDRPAPSSGPDPAGPPGGIPRERTADTFPKLTVRRREAPIAGREPALRGGIVAACPGRDRRVGRWAAGRHGLSAVGRSGPDPERTPPRAGVGMPSRPRVRWVRARPAPADLGDSNPCRSPKYCSTEMGIGIREGEAPAEPLPSAGSPGGSPSRGISRPFLRGAVLSGSQNVRWPGPIGGRSRLV
jgi:hypothetical protein